MDLTRWLDKVPVLLHTWYPGQEGGTSVAQILFGEHDPEAELRDGSAANLIRMGRMSQDDRFKNIAAARMQRMRNLTLAADFGSDDNPAVGLGEREIAFALEGLGHKVIRQRMVEGYQLDLSIGHVAIEVKFNARGCFTFGKRERREKLFECGFSHSYLHQ